MAARAYDITGAIPPDSWYGTLIGGALNLHPTATVLEVVAYLAYLATVLALYMRATAPRAPSPAFTAAPTGLARDRRVILNHHG